MPYIRRDANGKIVALLAEPAPDASEVLSLIDPEVERFLSADANVETFRALDLDFVRVTEDLIQTLIEKGVLAFTDLPHEAQQKLQARGTFRNRALEGALNLGVSGKESGSSDT